MQSKQKMMKRNLECVFKHLKAHLEPIVFAGFKALELGCLKDHFCPYETILFDSVLNEPSCFLVHHYQV